MTTKHIKDLCVFVSTPQFALEFESEAREKVVVEEQSSSVEGMNAVRVVEQVGRRISCHTRIGGFPTLLLECFQIAYLIFGRSTTATPEFLLGTITTAQRTVLCSLTGDAHSVEKRSAAARRISSIYCFGDACESETNLPGTAINTLEEANYEIKYFLDASQSQPPAAFAGAFIAYRQKASVLRMTKEYTPNDPSLRGDIMCWSVRFSSTTIRHPLSAS